MMAEGKILVIDDEPSAVYMAKVRLEANNYEVITAHNGEDGLAKAAQEGPDLILLDVTMPGIDGFEVLHRLKSERVTKFIPVIMLTCKGETPSIFKAEELGVSDYVIKPFEPAELLKAIRKYI